MKKINIILLLLLITGALPSCRKYLDEKPDSSFITPQSLNDCTLMLDDYATMNLSYPSDGEAAADNYYITDPNYNGLSDLNAKENYIWNPDAKHPNQWSAPYKTVFVANQVLQLLDKLPDSSPEYMRVKGSALFFRAFAFYHLAQLFTKPYDNASVETDMGIPLRLSPDLDLKTPRGTLKEVYNRMILDLKDAVNLLPTTTIVQSRPNKAAAYAALARVYLTMEDYVNAGTAANQALSLHGNLMDFKTTTSIPRFNTEVIFQALTLSSSNSTLNPTIAKINEDLYNSYQTNDRRKTVFFRANTGAANGTYAFRGSYDGFTNSSLFTGLATDELYLIRAECLARAGNLKDAMADLNFLLKNRYDETFVPLTAANADVALSLIITERRKELVFRNQRWTDLRRLNKDSRFKITLNRSKNTIQYTPLIPDDLRYTMLIPIDIETSLSGIPQNPR